MPVVNELIGNFGKYHLWLCFLVFISKFGVAYHQMAIIFLAPPAHYKCPGSNNSCCDDPQYDKSVFSRTIVTEWNLICQSAWLSDFHQMMFQFGVLSGSLLCGIASDKYGRKPTLIVSVIMEVFTGIMASFLPDYWSFTIMRALVGFSVGGVTVVGFVIIMEYVGHAYRDVVSALFHVPFTMGHIILAYIGYLIRDYMHFQLTISALNIILLVYICLLPETPRWFLAVNKTVKAIDLMERIAKMYVSRIVIHSFTFLFEAPRFNADIFHFSNGLPTEEIRHKIELYQMDNIHVVKKKGTVIDLFRTPNIRKNMLVMSFMWLVCSYCFYGMAHYLSHLTGDVYINVVSCGGVCLCSCFLSIPVIKFLKRKTMVILAYGLSSLSFFCIIFMPQGNWSIALGSIGCLFNYMVFIVIYLYCSELFPTVVRNAALGISSMMARVGAMIAPFVAGLRPYGKWCAPLAFGIFPLMAALLCLLLPETKDCELMTTLEESEAFGMMPSQNQTEQSNRNQVIK